MALFHPPDHPWQTRICREDIIDDKMRAPGHRATQRFLKTLRSMTIAPHYLPNLIPPATKRPTRPDSRLQAIKNLADLAIIRTIFQKREPRLPDRITSHTTPKPAAVQKIRVIDIKKKG